MSYIHENIIYDEVRLIDPQLLKPVSHTLPNTGQHVTMKTDAEIKSEHTYESKTSSRNIAGSYLIDTDSDDVLLNLIPKKRFITDTSLSYIVNNRFTYFEEPILAADLPEPFVLPEATIFRVANEGVLPKSDYTYYTIENGNVKQLNNFETVEVMLFERGKTLDEIRVIEPTEFEDLVAITLRNSFMDQGMSLAEANEELARFIYNS